jgi:predicted alpha/beta superfamily hydrolase
MEYGTANKLDYMQRGAKSALYNRFILEELLPIIQEKLGVPCFDSISYAGFSLGGLSAIDTVWNHPNIFSIAGVFSGSLWWRSKDLLDGYDEEKDRIMHQQVQEGKYHSGLRFYFTTGSQDETADRNNNGIIDSIDDTLGLIAALKKKGYTDKEIYYINYEDGRHDVETWGRAFPDFLKWGWGIVSPKAIQSPESC